LRINLEQQIRETNERIDQLRMDLEQQIRETNDRINKLYEVIVRREEHSHVVMDIKNLEYRVRRLEDKIKPD